MLEVTLKAGRFDAWHKESQSAFPPQFKSFVLSLHL